MAVARVFGRVDGAEVVMEQTQGGRMVCTGPPGPGRGVCGGDNSGGRRRESVVYG